MKAITLKSIFYSNIRYYNVLGEPFPSSDNNKMISTTVHCTN